jgi:hypothetical protein
VGFPDADQVGAPQNNAAGDANVTGTPGPNTGPIHTGQGEEVNVTITNPDVFIDAVVVKGGNGYNVYSNQQVLPPAVLAPQHYISPLNGGGNVPDLSHWFICYRLTTRLVGGTLVVRKTVIPPVGPPVDPLPTSVTVLVNCDDGDPAHQNVVVTFSRGGGRSAASTLTGIPAGTVCTVVEQNPSSLPPGAVVSYTPPGADTAGVTIEADAAVTVTVTNDRSGLAVQSGNLQVVKTVLPAPPVVTLPPSYTARVLCDDGTDTSVTLPGTGGRRNPSCERHRRRSLRRREGHRITAGWMGSHVLRRRRHRQHDSGGLQCRLRFHCHGDDHQRPHRRSGRDDNAADDTRADGSADDAGHAAPDGDECGPARGRRSPARRRRPRHRRLHDSPSPRPLPRHLSGVARVRLSPRPPTG